METAGLALIVLLQIQRKLGDMSNTDEITALLRESLATQKRTTHAVRAVARFLVLQFTYSLIGGVFLIVGFNSDPYSAGGWFFLGGLSSLGGLIHSLTAAGIDVRQSNAYADTSEDNEYFEKAKGLLLQRGEAQEESPSGISREDQYFLAARYLTHKQTLDWEKAGHPDLQIWLELGKPPFGIWLNNTESHAPRSASE